MDKLFFSIAIVKCECYKDSSVQTVRGVGKIVGVSNTYINFSRIL